MEIRCTPLCEGYSEMTLHVSSLVVPTKLAVEILQAALTPKEFEKLSHKLLELHKSSEDIFEKETREISPEALEQRVKYRNSFEFLDNVMRAKANCSSDEERWAAETQTALPVEAELLL